MTIRTAAVIGAGAMGSGIATLFANAGIPVLLMDLPSASGPRNATAEAGIAVQLKRGGFALPDRVALVTPGNIEDDLHRLGEVDWIIEAIVERLEPKQALYRTLESVRRADCVLSSNTSTIPLGRLVEGMGERFQHDFMITHFFNPPHIMPLLELVAGPATAAQTQLLVRAGAGRLGKTVIDCKDTPGFIANRIGCFWIAMAVLEGMQAGLTVEEADAVASAPFGMPKLGPFGLLDLIGIDLVPQVWGSLADLLPPRDGLQCYDLPGHPLIRHMIEGALHGRKTGQGFYRRVLDGSYDMLDLHSRLYRAMSSSSALTLPADITGLRQLCERDDDAGRYALRLVTRLAGYAASVAPEIADDIGAIDTAMRLGYGWTEGPFEMADRLGVAWLADQVRAIQGVVPALLAEAARRESFYAS